MIRAAVPLLGLRSGTMEYQELERAAGRTKYTFRKMASLAVEAVLTVSTRPLRLASGFALGVTGFATLWAFGVLYAFASGKTVAGWASVMLAVLALGALQLAGIAILGLYVARLYDVVLGRGVPFVRDVTSRAVKE